MSKRIFGSSCAIAFLLLCVHGPVNKEGVGKLIVNVLTAFEEQNGPWKPFACLLLLSWMFLLSFLPLSPFPILFPSLPQFFTLLTPTPLFFWCLLLEIFSLSPIVCLISHSGDCFSPSAGTNDKGDSFCFRVLVSCLLVSVLYPFFSLTPGTVLLESIPLFF